MQDIAVKISKATRMVDKKTTVIGNAGENLQTRLVFSFTDEFINGIARLEYELSDGTQDFIMLTEEEETYFAPITNLIMKSGIVHMQVVINEAGIDIPIFKSNIFRFRINDSLNIITVEPTGYQQWLDIANEKLAEVENVNITAEKIGNVSTITVTDRFGNEEQVEVLDGEQGPVGPQGPQGEPGEGSVDDVLVNNESVLRGKIAKINIPTWSLNPTKPSYDYEEINNKPDLSIYATNQALNTETTNRQNANTNLQNQIDALANANDVVDVLATYQDLLDYDTTHLKNNDIIKVMTDSTHQNAISYFKWVIVDETGNWSYVGSQGPFYTKGETDNLLNQKVAFTNYATENVGGVVKTNTIYGVGTNSSTGYLYSNKKTYSEYVNALDNMFISKGTLENVLTGKGLVKATTISSSSTDDNVVTPKAVYDYIQSLDATEEEY